MISNLIKMGFPYAGNEFPYNKSVDFEKKVHIFTIFFTKKIFLYFAICIHKTTGFFFFLYAILTLRVTYEIYK